ncbi:MAG: AGE family epimerase/isomerase [Clostridia bacterium]|nr:AGE family epimerase/isomerase [Clostridia bacterium]
MDRKYQLDTAENRRFLRESAQNLLDFARRFPSPGGSAWYLGDSGEPWPDLPRETFATARMAHAYALGTLMGADGSPALADAALRGLEEFADSENGGWCAGLTSTGRRLRGKSAFTHAYIILAASSALIAGRPGAAALLKRALTAFSDFFWLVRDGAAASRWDSSRQDPYRGLNANLHAAEAYLAAADALDDPVLRERAGRILQRFTGYAEENGWRVPEHYDQNWTPQPGYNEDKKDDPFRPYGLTPGHSFILARLLLCWALPMADVDPERTGMYMEAAQKLFDRAVQDAWQRDGQPGFIYTTDQDGTPIVHDRMHWVLAEAIQAAAALYRATSAEQYADWYAQFMEYLDTAVMDHDRGSWFHQLDAENHPADTVWPGKPDISHALQACLAPYLPPDRSLARGLSPVGA